MAGVGMLGAFAFGTIIGWYIYYINRYRKGEVGFNDLTALVGAIGGGAVTTLFPSDGGADANLFGAYGIGLAVGFFTYFLVLVVLVYRSENFNSDWFLDGRRVKAEHPWEIPDSVRQTAAAMSTAPTGAARSHDEPVFHGKNPAVTVRLPIEIQPVVTPTEAQPSNRGAPAPAMYPAGTAEAAEDRVKKACEQTWGANKDNCNVFVHEVARRFSVTLDGDTDAIMATIKGSGWRREPTGKKAAEAAEAGRLVIGGLTSAEMGDEHGHLVVVVGGALEHGKYPRAYWGSQNEDIRQAGKGGVGVNRSFGKDHRDKVYYASMSI